MNRLDKGCRAAGRVSRCNTYSNRIICNGIHHPFQRDRRYILTVPGEGEILDINDVIITSPRHRKYDHHIICFDRSRDLCLTGERCNINRIGRTRMRLRMNKADDAEKEDNR